MMPHGCGWRARLTDGPESGFRRWWWRAAGLAALLWFVLRVTPKPSRAAYPCQQCAAPLAGGFVVWFAGGLVPASLFHRKAWARLRVVLPLACAAVAAALVLGILTGMPQEQEPVEGPNRPMGVGKGVHPGRVVWVHNPAATPWKGPGDGHWWEETRTIQSEVDRMMSQAVLRLAGETRARKAWDALFRNFNQARNSRKAGYRKGEKIAIKVNFVGCIFGDRNVDTKTWELGLRRKDYMDTSPQMIRALLRQLVKEAGVRPEDISVGDPLSLFPKQYYDLLHGEFPGVRYVDYYGGNQANPRTKVEYSKVPLYWSVRPEGKDQDYVPAHYAEAAYLVNMASWKGHTMAGVTLCAKNHFGSLIRTPPQKGYFDMHANTAGRNPGMGKYRELVDLTGHAHLGGKTFLYFIDGLYTGVHGRDDSPRKWMAPPFDGRWAASLLASQDPVAIDSVGLDFLRAESDNSPRMPSVDDYLHEAALASNPPSGTFYDPDHAAPTARLASLGVHEHWNNARERLYSRNLGKGQGIELVKVGR
ncbi:MAG: DUF362 domain-containing protein [Bryobacterales bacterium]|nr:DUF362 domain-containing protein [Bryobacterales bacterium]